MFSRYSASFPSKYFGTWWFFFTFAVYIVQSFPAADRDTRSSVFAVKASPQRLKRLAPINLDDDKLLFDWKETRDIQLGAWQYPGEFYVIDCRVGDPTLNVSLLHKYGRSLKEITPDGKTITKSNQIFNITNLQFSDRGFYYCRANNRTDKGLGRLYVARDGIPFQTPTIKNGTKIKADTGDTIFIVCEVTGWYDMDWWYNTTSKLPSQEISYWRDRYRIISKRLEVKNVSSGNAGKYQCVVRRYLVKWKGTATINVIEKPKNQIRTAPGSTDTNKLNNQLNQVNSV